MAPLNGGTVYSVPYTVTQPPQPIMTLQQPGGQRPRRRKNYSFYGCLKPSRSIQRSKRRRRRCSLVSRCSIRRRRSSRRDRPPTDKYTPPCLPICSSRPPPLSILLASERRSVNLTTSYDWIRCFQGSAEFRTPSKPRHFHWIFKFFLYLN